MEIIISKWQRSYETTSFNVSGISHLALATHAFLCTYCQVKEKCTGIKADPPQIVLKSTDVSKYTSQELIKSVNCRNLIK